MLKGIDVSAYQGNIAWNKVKESGVSFAILKVIRKDLNPDKQFEANWKNATAAGMPIQGVYNYSYATTVAKAKADAARVLEVLAGRKTMVWLDVEDACMKGLGKLLVDIISAYGDVIKTAGLTFGVYTGLSFYNTYMKPYARNITDPFWIARYPSSKTMKVSDNAPSSKKPGIQHDLYGWQYSSKGSIPGISGAVDLDELYVDLASADTVPAEESKQESFYPQYTGTSGSIVDALAAVGEKDTSKAHRAKIAAANGISNYAYTASQNIRLLKLLKAGKLKKA